MTVLVTGYVPIKDHVRSAEEYGKLGELFTQIDCEKADCVVMPFYETVEQTWLHKYITGLDIDEVTHSQGDYPQKNTFAYHCVQHQKFAWLARAALSLPRHDTFIWVDYGIGHVPGVTAEVIQNFLESVEPDDFAIPGCWEQDQFIRDDNTPCWRFCGGLMAVPRSSVLTLYTVIKDEVTSKILLDNHITWEVNSLAEAEHKLPIRWYKADHNQTMFTNYGDGLDPNRPKRAAAREMRIDPLQSLGHRKLSD